MTQEPLERKLDLLIALTRVGVREQLEAELAELKGDPVSSTILKNAAEEIAAGKLKTVVMKATGQSEPTVKRRLAELVARGAISRDGAGGSITYRSTGLFSI